MALMKLCRCGVIIEYSKKYCDSCSVKYEKEKAESIKYYDKNIRDKRSIAFYSSPEWLTIREYILAKYKGLDLYAYFILNEIAYADTVHHIVELKDDWGKGLVVSNLFPLTSSNHGKIHKMYKKDKEGTQKMLRGLINRWVREIG
jgi:hypothetical protein